MTEAKVVDLHAAISEVMKMDTGSTGRATLPLVSLGLLKVLVVGIGAGKVWGEHSTPGRITVQVLQGRLRMSANGESHELGAGQLIALEGNVKHDLEGMEDCAFLLTVARSNDS